MANCAGAEGFAISRRHWLGASAAGIAAWMLARESPAAAFSPALKSSVLRYLAGLARPEGGFAWDDQPTAHLSPTFAAVGCHHLLGASVPDAGRHTDWIRKNHPSAWKKLEQEHRDFDLQQMQALRWLGNDLTEFRERVRGWRKPVPYLKQYERHGYPVFRHQVTAFVCRPLLGLPVDDLDPEFLEYLNSRRRPNGSFNNTPAGDGTDGNILNTLWGLRALATLKREAEHRDATIAWVHACQGTHQPQARSGGAQDIAYLWAAVRCLDLLQDDLSARHDLAEQMLALRNADGGFGDRPGWPSNAPATYCAVDALSLLPQPPTVMAVAPAQKNESLPDSLKVFSIQIEAHGQGSPAEAVELARSLRIHLWGAKNARPGWLKSAQAIADREQVPVTFFVANEEYGTWVDFPGFGTYSHTSDIIAPAGVDIGPSLADAGVVTWEEYRERRLKPLEAAGGRVIWQFGENEELVRTLLDDSVDRGGYAAISTFHFGNPDFTNSEPFLKRYRGRLPFIALQDAHGPEPWWFSDMTTGFRTLFLAREATWEGWLEALRQNRVVAVRRDDATNGQLRMHGGTPETVAFVQSHEREWRWWDNPAISRPLLSIVAIRPEDEYEVGRPDRGVALRIRCAWENTTQGQPKTPLVDFVALTVDGQQVVPERMESRGGRNGGLSDVVYRWADTADVSGPRFAEVIGKVRKTGVEIVRKLRY